jgi:hypothetical protein
MAVILCPIGNLVYRLEYQRDHSDNSYSGILEMQKPLLFSYSDAQFIPAIDDSRQQAIKEAISAHEALEGSNREI